MLVFARFPRTRGDRPKRRGLFFKKRLLRRYDAISYEGDKFGDVRGSTVDEFQGFTPAAWKKFSKRTQSNETIFKYSITIMDNLEKVVVRNAAERDRLLKVFVKHGIEEVPDGRKVEKLIVVK